RKQQFSIWHGDPPGEGTRPTVKLDVVGRVTSPGVDLFKMNYWQGKKRYCEINGGRYRPLNTKWPRDAHAAIGRNNYRTMKKLVSLAAALLLVTPMFAGEFPDISITEL